MEGVKPLPKNCIHSVRAKPVPFSLPTMAFLPASSFVVHQYIQFEIMLFQSSYAGFRSCPEASSLIKINVDHASLTDIETMKSLAAQHVAKSKAGRWHMHCSDFNVSLEVSHREPKDHLTNMFSFCLDIAHLSKALNHGEQELLSTRSLAYILADVLSILPLNPQTHEPSNLGG